jgi:FMN-dependent NADH-azoreductase
MPNLLHIDSSVNGDASVSRTLTARAANVWRAANPRGTVTYRDLAAEPVPHMDTGTTFLVPPDQHTPAQAATYALGLELVAEIKAADAIVLGLGLYNYGPPSTVKSWFDHLVIPGVTVDPATMGALLEPKPLSVVLARGGGYGEGTPRHGWDHAEAWLPHALSAIGFEARLIVAELTLAGVNPALAQFIPLAEQSRADAEAEIDALFSPAAV